MNEFYREYLDACVERRGTHCVKWDRCEARFGSNDILPLWVADMDFRTAPAISEAIVERAQHAVYGYTWNADNEKAAEIGWIKRRYGLDIQADWILYSPGVVDSLYFAVRALTQAGDSILIQPPVYGPFYRSVAAFGRNLVKNNLKYTENGWEMDFEQMEDQFKQGVKMMIFCNPHNPIGRVWKRDEVRRVVELAGKYGVIVLADEIHADFNLGETKHTRIFDIENSDHCIMLTSATKSFNLAGLRQSSVIIKDEQLRKTFAAEIAKSCADAPNIFGAIAQTAAYNHGDEWMDAVVEYIRENRDFAVDYIRKNIPQIKVDAQDGTYLMWLDCRALGLEHEAFAEKLVREAHVGLNDGTEYGEEGRGFFRLNLATRRANIQTALENIEKLVRSMYP